MYSRTRGYLPHPIQPAGTYFVTFRLADSLPASVLTRWKDELRFNLSRVVGFAHRQRLKDGYEQAVENYLDTSFGDCWLKKAEIASIVDNAIRYFNNSRYQLLASWKSFTAHEANRALSRTGEFWQREYFDRLIKNERQLEFTLRYILNNPVKAGLCKEIFEWRWTGCCEEMQVIAKKFFL